MKKNILKFFALFLIVFTNSVHAQSIVINEILTSNTNINTDEDGSYQDWIELYNNGSASVNLSGFGLTDDVNLIYKWVFPNVTLASGQYLLVWCSGKNRTDPANPLHTNFKLSATGEAITLTNTSGVTVDSIPATILFDNISYGRLPNGTGSFVFFTNVTPDAVNSTLGYNQILSPPTFSQNGGFYTSGLNLNLSTTIAGATILYTLDGSEPAETNIGGTTYRYKNQYPELPSQSTGPLINQSFQTLQYTSPISIADRSVQPNKIASISSTYDFNPTYIPSNPIYKETVVRAKVVKTGALSSVTTTKNYFITAQGASRFPLPVISLSTNENGLFDYYNGIYVAGSDFDNWRIANPNTVINFNESANYTRAGVTTEKGANMNYFVNGVEVLNQDIGIRIHGGTTRAFRSKAFTLSAYPQYGKNSMDYKFFSDVADNSFKSLVLRNSGGDFINTMFRDALNNRLIKGLHVQTESYQPTVTFINSEYWGILNIRENLDDKYFSRIFNISSTELDQLQNNAEVKVGDNIDYLSMTDYITNNSLISDTNYNYLLTRMDPESFSDYFISNIFFQNADWPGTNIDYWRKKTAGFIPNAPYGCDGRWRWAIHDMDDTFSFGTADFAHNNLADATAVNGPVYPNPAWSTLFLRKLLNNNTFKINFINRFADLMNTSFLSSRVVATINDMKSVIAPEMPEHIARWQVPATITDWNGFINDEQNFANARPAFQRNHIRLQFGIASNINATLNVSDINAGYITMNTINVKSGTPGINSNPYPWTGIYFSNIPVTLKAVANNGYTFSHWTGASTSTNPVITITSATSFAVTAVFVTETIPTSHPIYFWMMNSAIINNFPLQTLNTTYKTSLVDGVIQFQSCLVGYPFTSSSLSWRKASMERRNSTTELNYIPEANANLSFALSDMKALQIKEPLQNNGLENIMVFKFATTGYKDIKFSFAAMNELTNATNIVMDYAVNVGTPVWTTAGLSASAFPLSSVYQLFSTDFTSIMTANNNADFKIRLRFTGTNMTADTGQRITFNNIAVMGTQIQLAVTDSTAIKFSVYPNPVSSILNVTGDNQAVFYKLFTIDGKLIKGGNLENNQIDLVDLSQGMYLLQLASNGKIEIKKIIKK